MTNDYSMFVKDKHNRQVVANQKVINSMKAHGFIPQLAIITYKQPDGKLLIIDGHHRFQFAQDLKIPLWYSITDDRTIKPQELVGRPWSLVDFITAHMVDNTHLKCIYKNAEACGVNHVVMAALLSGKWTGVVKSIRDLTIKVDGVDHANSVLKVTEAAGKAVKWSKSSRFIQAISYAIKFSKMDQKILIDRIAAHPTMLQPQTNLDGYIKMIEDIHNFSTRNKSKVNIVFQVKQALRGESE